jgi:hypothetical protein
MNSGKGAFPGLLKTIGELGELFRVHSERARHLDMRVRQMEPAARLDPGSQRVRNRSPVLGHGRSSAAWVVKRIDRRGDFNNQPTLSPSTRSHCA